MSDKREADTLPGTGQPPQFALWPVVIEKLKSKHKHREAMLLSLAYELLLQAENLERLDGRTEAIAAAVRRQAVRVSEHVERLVTCGD